MLCVIIIIIIMQHLTRHVSVIMMTNRRGRLMLGANGAYRDVTKLKKAFIRRRIAT